VNAPRGKRVTSWKFCRAFCSSQHERSTGQARGIFENPVELSCSSQRERSTGQARGIFEILWRFFSSQRERSTGQARGIFEILSRFL